MINKSSFFTAKKFKDYFTYISCYVLAICFISFLPASEMEDILKTMPEDDRQALHALFYRLMYDDHFSYTLFGDKAVSSSGDFILTPCGNIIRGMKCGGIFWKNWEVWKRYEPFFPMSHYLLIEEPSHDNVKSIIFINKKAFLQVVNQYLDLFREILGEKTTASNLLRKIEKNRRFFSFIKENQLLFGLLLGYGEHNSKLFFERHKLGQFIKSKKLPIIPHKIPEHSKQFSSLLDEYHSFQSKLLPFGEHAYSVLTIQSVHFMADPSHLETKALQQKYQKLRGKISARYAQGNFLDITLSQLTSDSP